jgi:hypothetical protein
VSHASCDRRSTRREPTREVRELLLLAFIFAQLGCSGSGPAVAGEAGRADLARDGQARDGLAADGRADLRVGETAPVVCPERRVLTAEVTNARDVGGHPLAGGKQTACRRYLRGGSLGGLSATGCSEFAALGIKTVIDLREPAVQTSEPPPACVTATRVLAPMPKLLPDTPANYLELFKETAAITKVFATLGDASSYPVYLHCIIGRDRASFMTALVLSAAGATRATVVEEFKLSSAAGVAVKPECIEAVLDEVDKRGGIEATLTAAGVSAAQLGVLRAELGK